MRRGAPAATKCLAMSRLIDSLSGIGQRWTAVCGLELDEVQRVILAYCGRDFKKAYRMRSAYELIASKRDAETLNASVSDNEVAARIPKERGDGFISGSNYSRTIKRDLLACGLLNASTDRRAEATAPTVYSFPMLERLLCIGANESAQHSNAEAGDLTHSEQCTSIYGNEQCVVHSAYTEANNSCVQASADIHTSRNEEFQESKSYGLEKGGLYNPVSLPKWTPYDNGEECPFCGARGSTGWAVIGGVDYVHCSACGAKKLMTDWENAKYSVLQAVPDIPF